MTISGSTNLSGSEARPAVTLTSGNYTLVENTDYTLEYGNNTKEGSRAWVTATAKRDGHFSGTQSLNFTVTDDSISKVLSNIDYELYLKNPSSDVFSPASTLRTYSLEEGATAGPAVMVMAKNPNGTRTPLATSNYKVDYGNISKSGLAYVKVTGEGEYSGSLSANFFVIVSGSYVEPLTATASTSPVQIGQTATFECSVTGAGSAALSYQWQFSNDGGATWKDSPLATADTASYSLEATSFRASKQTLRCVVTASDGRTATTGAVGFEISYSSLDFFSSVNAPEAISAIRNFEYYDQTDEGAEGDATNLENMAAAIDYIKYCNSIRESLGLSPLCVTSQLMGKAQANVNWSDTSMEHAPLGDGASGENLAWGSRTPAEAFDG